MESSSPSPPNPNPNAPPSPATALPPTTFVQADPRTFRDVVQRLTGAPVGDSPSKLPVTASHHRPSPVPPRRPPFKLQDRRPSAARKLEIKLSHSRLSFSTPPKSPVTPLSPGALPSPAPTDEDRAVADKVFFYLHPSPRGSDPSPNPPELLPLFPLTSPKQQQQQQP